MAARMARPCSRAAGLHAPMKLFLQTGEK